MKQVLSFLCFMFCSYFLQAQEIDMNTVPANVIDKFSLLYPDAKSISWQLLHDHYEAIFHNDKMATIARIAADGSLLRTETEIRTIALPTAAYAYLETLIDPKKIGMAVIIQDQAGIITFEAMTDKLEYTFDAEGNLTGISESMASSKL